MMDMKEFLEALLSAIQIGVLLGVFVSVIVAFYESVIFIIERIFNR